MDVLSAGRGSLELRPELADVDVDRAVSRTQLTVPDGVTELIAAHDAAGSVDHRDEQLELPDREGEYLAAGRHQPFAEPDLEVIEADGALLVLVLVSDHAAQARAWASSRG